MLGYSPTCSARVAQNRKHLIGDVRGVGDILILQTIRCRELTVNKQNIAQYGKQVRLQRTDNPAVNKRLFRRVDQLQFHAALAAQHVDVKIFKAGKQFVATVGLAAGVEHRQRTVAKQLVEIAAGSTLQHVDFQLGEQIH